MKVLYAGILTRLSWLILFAVLLVSLPVSASAEIPTQGLQVWLRADKGLELDTAGRVKFWQDQSGKDNHAYGDGAGPSVLTSRLNGQPVLAFDGASYLAIPNNEDGGLNADDAFSIIVVYRFDEGNSTNRIMQKRSNAYGTGYDAWIVVPGRGVGVANARAMKDLVLPGANYYIHTGVFDHKAGQLRLYINGVLSESVETLAPQTPNSHPIYIGKREWPGKDELFLKGEIAEILIYDSTAKSRRKGSFRRIRTGKSQQP
jgi:hypothetical protein